MPIRPLDFARLLAALVFATLASQARAYDPPEKSAEVFGSDSRCTSYAYMICLRAAHVSFVPMLSKKVPIALLAPSLRGDRNGPDWIWS
jgi:hypothetical protein